ncbi:MAG: hypothetical protein IPM10_09970 [Chitinophagaceae bacterium]|nr:hypothetical protein [Chitinophagaceae bacterium]
MPEATPNPKELDDYFNDPKVNKKYKMKKTQIFCALKLCFRKMFNKFSQFFKNFLCLM